MTNKTLINMKPKYILYILLSTFSLTSCDYYIVKKTDVIKVFEIAYFEGQRDALENDVRIRLNQDSCWIWIKSPWDSGRPPILNPSFECR